MKIIKYLDKSKFKKLVKIILFKLAKYLLTIIKKIKIKF